MKHYQRVTLVEMANKDVYGISLASCLGQEEESATKAEAVEESNDAFMVGFGANGKLWQASRRIKREVSKLLKPCTCSL